MISIVEGKVDLTPGRSLIKCREFNSADQVDLKNDLATYSYSQFLLAQLRRFSMPGLIIGELPAEWSQWMSRGSNRKSSLGLVGNIADTNARLFYNTQYSYNVDPSQQIESQLTIIEYFPEESDEFYRSKIYAQVTAWDHDGTSSRPNGSFYIRNYSSKEDQGFLMNNDVKMRNFSGRHREQSRLMLIWSQMTEALIATSL